VNTCPRTALSSTFPTRYTRICLVHCLLCDISFVARFFVTMRRIFERRVSKLFWISLGNLRCVGRVQHFMLAAYYFVSSAVVHIARSPQPVCWLPLFNCEGQLRFACLPVLPHQPVDREPGPVKPRSRRQREVEITLGPGR